MPPRLRSPVTHVAGYGYTVTTFTRFYGVVTHRTFTVTLPVTHADNGCTRGCYARVTGSSRYPFTVTHTLPVTAVARLPAPLHHGLPHGYTLPHDMVTRLRYLLRSRLRWTPLTGWLHDLWFTCTFDSTTGLLFVWLICGWCGFVGSLPTDYTFTVDGCYLAPVQLWYLPHSWLHTVLPRLVVDLHYVTLVTTGR